MKKCLKCGNSLFVREAKVITAIKYITTVQEDGSCDADDIINEEQLDHQWTGPIICMECGQIMPADSSIYLWDKITKLASLIQEETFERVRKEYPNTSPEFHLEHSKTRVRSGSKYTKVDVGTSGKYMVVNETGEIFGIKGYGVIHRGHQYGTLDTMDEFYWGAYNAYRKEN
jgi:hypothetical protein